MTIINEVGSVALPAVTITIPARTISITIPAVTVTLPAGALVATTPIDLSALAQDVAKILAASVVQPPVTDSTVLAVYTHGKFSWGGDYSWGVTIDYRDTSGAPDIGPTDISVTGIGGFQPYAPNFDFDPAPYKFLQFSLKPTIVNQLFSSAFYAVGDKLTGFIIDVLKYGPAPVVGEWTTYKIPLGVGGYQIPAGQHIYKFMIQDQTADQDPAKYGSTNKWYVDDIFFTAS